jgi:hypothetical protein
VYERLWMGFRLVTRFIDHLQIVSASNYNSLIALHTLKITHYNCSTHEVLTSRFLVTHPNNVLCLSPYRLANIPQRTHCFNWLTLRLAAVSHQPSSLLFTDSNSRLCTSLHCTALHSLIALVTSRHVPHRKHRSSIAVQVMLIKNLLPSSGRCLLSHYSATELHATICRYLIILPD